MTDKEYRAAYREFRMAANDLLRRYPAQARLGLVARLSREKHEVVKRRAARSRASGSGGVS